MVIIERTIFDDSNFYCMPASSSLLKTVDVADTQLMKNKAVLVANVFDEDVPCDDNFLLVLKDGDDQTMLEFRGPDEGQNAYIGHID